MSNLNESGARASLVLKN